MELYKGRSIWGWQLMEGSAVPYEAAEVSPERNPFVLDEAATEATSGIIIVDDDTDELAVVQ